MIHFIVDTDLMHEHRVLPIKDIYPLLEPIKEAVRAIVQKHMEEHTYYEGLDLTVRIGDIYVNIHPKNHADE